MLKGAPSWCWALPNITDSTQMKGTELEGEGRAAPPPPLEAARGEPHPNLGQRRAQGARSGDISEAPRRHPGGGGLGAGSPPVQIPLMGSAAHANNRVEGSCFSKKCLLGPTYQPGKVQEVLPEGKDCSAEPQAGRARWWGGGVFGKAREASAGTVPAPGPGPSRCLLPRPVLCPFGLEHRPLGQSSIHPLSKHNVRKARPQGLSGCRAQSLP